MKFSERAAHALEENHDLRLWKSSRHFEHHLSQREQQHYVDCFACKVTAGAKDYHNKSSMPGQEMTLSQDIPIMNTLCYR